MNIRNGFQLTNRDRVLTGWLHSTELVRDFTQYAAELEETAPQLSRLFHRYAKEEGKHAAELLSLLQKGRR